MTEQNALQLRDNAKYQLEQIKDIESGIDYLNKVKAIETWAKAEKPGVYFIYHENNIIYIGESKNIKKRLSSSQKIKYIKGKYNNFTVKIIEIENYNSRIEIERKFIKIFNPKYNGVLDRLKYKKSTDEEKIKVMIALNMAFDKTKSISDILGVLA